MLVSPPGAKQECGVVGTVRTDSYNRRVQKSLRCQVGIKAYVSFTDPHNYPAITAQLVVNELINVSDTSY